MRLHIAVFFLLVFAMACGGEDPHCTIADNGDGTRTIRCPDGVSVVVTGGKDGASCTLLRESGAGGTIVCDDGSTFRLGPDGKVLFPGSGSLTGIARLYGREEHDGIRVRTSDGAYFTHTNPFGRYRLENLPAGLYDLVFEARGRASHLETNIPVLNGVFELGAIELKHGRRTGPVDAVAIPSPTGRALLVQEARPTGRLVLWLDEGMRSVALSGTAYGPSFSPDGRVVLFVEDRSSQGRVMLWHVDEGRAEKLPLRGVEASFLPGGRVIAVESFVGGANGLAVYDRLTGRSSELGEWAVDVGWLPAPDGSSVVFLRPNRDLVLWDVVNGREAVLANAVQVPHARFTGDGATLLFTSPNLRGGRDLYRWEVGVQAHALVAADVDPGSLLVAPDDASVLFRVEEPSEGWRLWDRSGDRLLALGSGPSEARFDAGGAQVLVFTPTSASAGNLSLFSRADERWTLLSEAALGLPEVSPDGTHLAYEIDTGAGLETRLFRTRDGRERALPGGGWSFAPDGRHLVGLDGEGVLRSVHVESGHERIVATRVTWWNHGGDGALLLFRARQEGHPGERVGVYRHEDTLLLWGSAGAQAVATRSGASVLYLACDEAGSSCNDLTRFDLKEGYVELVERRVVDFWIEGRLLTYEARPSLDASDPENGIFLAILPDEASP